MIFLLCLLLHPHQQPCKTFPKTKSILKAPQKAPWEAVLGLCSHWEGFNEHRPRKEEKSVPCSPSPGPPEPTATRGRSKWVTHWRDLQCRVSGTASLQKFSCSWKCISFTGVWLRCGESNSPPNWPFHIFVVRMSLSSTGPSTKPGSPWES